VIHAMKTKTHFQGTHYSWYNICKCELRLDEDQMRRFRTECFAANDFLGQGAEMPPDLLADRKDTVATHLNQLLEVP
jgi:hypothetical protein